MFRTRPTHTPRRQISWYASLEYDKKVLCYKETHVILHGFCYMKMTSSDWLTCDKSSCLYMGTHDVDTLGHTATSRPIHLIVLVLRQGCGTTQNCKQISKISFFKLILTFLFLLFQREMQQDSHWNKKYTNVKIHLKNNIFEICLQFCVVPHLCLKTKTLRWIGPDVALCPIVWRCAV